MLTQHIQRFVQELPPPVVRTLRKVLAMLVLRLVAHGLLVIRVQFTAAIKVRVLHKVGVLGKKFLVAQLIIQTKQLAKHKMIRSVEIVRGIQERARPKWIKDLARQFLDAHGVRCALAPQTNRLVTQMDVPGTILIAAFSMATRQAAKVKLAAPGIAAIQLAAGNTIPPARAILAAEVFAPEIMLRVTVMELMVPFVKEPLLVAGLVRKLLVMQNRVVRGPVVSH